MELVARADGSLVKVLVPEGKTVPVGSVVAYIGAPGENVGGLGNGEAGKVAVAPAPAPPTLAPSPVPIPQSPIAGEAGRVKASPLAKRIARDSGLDLQRVQGSGPGGRVVKRDLEGAGRPAPTPAAAPMQPRTTHPAP